MRLGASPLLTQVAGAFVSFRCLSQAATRPTAPCASFQALIEAENTTSALKKDKIGLGAIRTRNRRDGVTVPWRLRVGRAKLVTHASHVAVEAATLSPGVGSMTRTPGGGSAHSMSFTEVRGSSQRMVTTMAGAAVVAHGKPKAV